MTPPTKPVSLTAQIAAVEAAISRAVPESRLRPAEKEMLVVEKCAVAEEARCEACRVLYVTTPWRRCSRSVMLPACSSGRTGHS